MERSQRFCKSTRNIYYNIGPVECRKFQIVTLTESAGKIWNQEKSFTIIEAKKKVEKLMIAAKKNSGFYWVTRDADC